MSIGCWINIDQSTVSRTVWKVTRAIINSYSNVFHHDIQNVKEQFFNKFGMPNILGSIDCTHVRICVPSQMHYPHEYLNRKKFYSYNVQAIRNSDCVFLDVVAAWPGSVHDSRILKNCAMHDSLIAGNNGILLGDNGYPLLPFLMTPFLNPASPEEEHYNRVHKRSCCTIERAFGQLKWQFHCLDSGLRCNIERISSTIIVCFVLHNLAKKWREPEFSMIL